MIAKKTKAALGVIFLLQSKSPPSRAIYYPYCVEICSALRKRTQANTQGVGSEGPGSNLMHCPSPNFLQYLWTQQVEAQQINHVLLWVRAGWLLASHHHHYDQQSPFLSLEKTTNFHPRSCHSPPQSLGTSTGLCPQDKGRACD